MADEVVKFDNLQNRDENTLKFKRLFIGGLYKDVSKDELRLKFKLFGDVKDLQIITRKDDTGDHIKTFAYMNIYISDKNFRKCLTTYNKCNWKGHVLKVEVAKDDYLIRLQKENQTNDNVKQADNLPNVPVVKDIKSAVPGTPVPNKRNWVVGKFGRVLPIVFLRRKDGKKIAKFDPSKTVHCLKKVSGNDDRHDRSVQNLTWNLDENSSHHNEQLSMKRPVEEIENNDKYETTEKFRRKKRNLQNDKTIEYCDVQRIESCSKIENEKTDFILGGLRQRMSNGDCDLSQCSKAGLANSSNSPFGFDESISLQSHFDLQGCENDDTQSLSSNDSSVSEDEVSNEYGSTSDDSSKESTLPSSFRNEQCGNNLPSKPRDNALATSKSSSEKWEERDEIRHKSYERYSDDQSYSSSSSNSCLSSDESLSQTELSKTKNSSNSESALTSLLDSFCADESSRTSKRNKSMNKKEVSNKLRLGTLEERTKVLQNRKEVVKNALQKVDAGSVKGVNHIVFENDDEDVDDNNGESREILLSSKGGKKITGAKSLAWLGMDSNSDEENNGFNKKDDEFLGKEHFYGESGEKLMKLQQTFGHDERFKMDERFLDSDREMETKSQTPVFEKDDLSKELTEEKIMSLKILSDVLGTNSMWVGENEDPRNLYRDSVDTRYDPSRQDHIKFEEDMARPDSPKQNDENYVVDKIPETDEPVATQEKYYNVSDSIKSLFSDKDKECSTFSFFPELEGKKDDVETSNSLEIEETIGWKAPVKLSQALPYDSSESESDEDAALPAADVIPSKVNTKRSLFYHPEDQAMMETLEAESSSFIRKESVDDLTRYWVEVRQQLTQDYKKKRKDALRRQKRRAER